MRRSLLVACLLASVAGCTHLPPSQYRTFDISPGPAAELDYRGIPLRSGQIIVSDQGSRLGFFVSLLGERFEPWIHSGVVAIEEREPFVYEAMGDIGPYLSGPPSDATKGRIRRTSLATYLARQRIAAIYDPPLGVDASRVVEFARAQFLARTPFDPYFDDRDRQKLYCTELVAAALEHGGALPIVPVRFSQNSSITVVREWLKMDSDSIVLAGSLVADSHRVALLSPRFSSGEIAAFFAVKRELHRRFTNDQRLGFLFQWGLTGVGFRQQVAQFVADGMAEGQVHGSGEIDTVVRQIADRMLGIVDATTLETASRPQREELGGRDDGPVIQP